MIKNKTVQKLISTLVIISMLAPSVAFFARPQKAEAQFHDIITGIWTGLTSIFTASSAATGAQQTAMTVKNVAKEITRQVLMTIARRFLQELTKSTVNWINTGNWGNPLFIQNPGSFFKDIAKFEVKTMVDMFGYDSKKYPFGKSFALNVINSYKSQLDINAEYTLNKVMTESEARNFRNNFNIGGWNGFLINTQFPQNNYIGFQMLATEELARRVNGYAENKVEQVKKTLDQGAGFLSPKKCTTNPSYNNLQNEFMKPSFNPDKDFKPYVAPVPGPSDYGPNSDETGGEYYTEEFNQKVKEAEEAYQIQLASAKGMWEVTNSCPNKPNGTSGFEATTPGSVIANQLTNAMGSQFRQSELAAAMGNSISAVLDAFLNKFMDKGLNALATKVNPKATTDNWSYNGLTLGSGEDGTNAAWNAGPDEEINVDKFKKQLDGKTIVLDANGAIIREEVGNTGNGEYTPGDIANTEEELRLLDNEDIKNPGIIQVMGQIWPRARELDICIPGPDLGWKDRAQEEMERNSQKLQEKSSDSDGEKAAAAQSAFKELEFAVNFFKDWIENKMMTELPNSILFIDAVEETTTLPQQADEVIKNRRIKAQSLARLQAIKRTLAAFSAQPATGSGQEKVLITLRKQYYATADAIGKTASIEDAKNELAIAKEKAAKLAKFVTQCKAERKESGWSDPGGWRSSFKGRMVSCSENASIAITKPLPNTMTPGQIYELKMRVNNTGTSFWYHGDYFQFAKKSGNLDPDPLFGGLPYAVASNSSKPEFRYVDWTFEITAPSTPGNYSFDMQMVHKQGSAYIRLLDDTKTPNGTDYCSNKTPTSDTYFGDTITVSMSVVGSNVQNVATTITLAPASDPIIPASPAGTEKALFCDLPIKGGYSHESFVQTGQVTYPETPLVNAQNILQYNRGWGGIFGQHKVKVEISCNVIYKANVLDYKGNLPGLTPVVPYEEMPYEFSSEEEGASPPADAETKHDNHTAEVETAKSALAAQGRTWVIDMPTPEEYECKRFEIINNAAKLISGAGILKKPGGTNCQGYSVDIIAFPDGYIYDVLGGGGADGASPMWGPVGCGTAEGDGTCADRFASPISYP